MPAPAGGGRRGQWGWVHWPRGELMGRLGGVCGHDLRSRRVGRGPGVPSSPGSQADPPTPWGPLRPTFLLLTIDSGLRPGEAGGQRDDWVCGDPVVPGA